MTSRRRAGVFATRKGEWGGGGTEGTADGRGKGVRQRSGNLRRCPTGVLCAPFFLSSPPSPYHLVPSCPVPSRPIRPTPKRSWACPSRWRYGELSTLASTLFLWGCTSSACSSLPKRCAETRCVCLCTVFCCCWCFFVEAKRVLLNVHGRLYCTVEYTCYYGGP